MQTERLSTVKTVSCAFCHFSSSASPLSVISGPTNLRVVKTTSTSAVIQWEKSQGEIDRYRLTITPSDGAGSSEEITVPANQDSAHIQQLEAGQLYDIILVAEKGTSQKKDADRKRTNPSSPPSSKGWICASTLSKHGIS
uniref:Fibronectin type-III domain-containing protein n=1 Tax=Seriola lalandi dorsalis TaxID=1841481 RepID=A0A3B4Y8F9_SERLL